tara:strand:- start:21 stop:536 length:516 start_codon:yes stop_codon:yes gene_type:complete
MTESFPKRLFVMGAGPSLEILYEHRHEANDWGDWAVVRSDLVQPLLKFIKPKYTIRYWPKGRSFNTVYGISLEENTKRMGGSSIGAFILNFQEHGGKELFLFGFDGDSSGYWRNQPGLQAPIDLADHGKDCDDMADLPVWESTKLYHIGKTRNKFMTEISIDDLKGTYLNA